jgi:hypothetical protein
MLNLLIGLIVGVVLTLIAFAMVGWDAANAGDEGETYDWGFDPRTSGATR